MKNNFKALIRIIYELNYIMTSTQKRRAMWLLLVIVISAGFELLGVTAILPFVQAVIAPDKMMQNKYIAKFAPVFGIDDSNTLLLSLGVGLILLYILKNAFMLYANYVQYDFSSRLQKEMTVKMLHSYMNRPYTYFLDTNTSEILRGCANDIESAYNIIENLSIILSQLLTVFLIGLFLVYTDPMIAVSVLVLMVIVFLGMVFFFKPAIKKAGFDSMELNTLKSKILVQTVSGIKEIFVAQKKEFFLEEYEEASDRFRKAQRIYSVLSNSPDKIVEGICISGIIGIVCIRLASNSGDMLTFIPKLAAFAVAAFRIFPSISKLINRITGIIYNYPGMDKVYQNMQEANRYEKQMKQYVGEDEAIALGNLGFHDRLVINHVFWKYDNQHNPVLSDAFLTIRRGESIALIGASGAGKTTLADIILGLLRPSKGNILMDGVDVYTIPKTWARIVGYVPQSVYLLDDTVRNNIAFGTPVEMVNDKYIWQALEKAQLKDFIQGLPGGLDTIVGERGIKFSGGQRQRIAIARALYNKPGILVLDEATAALDNETETAVMESIDALQGQITMIIVAHRLSTIRNCDKVYEIKDGVAVERSKGEVLGL